MKLRPLASVWAALVLLFPAGAAAQEAGEEVMTPVLLVVDVQKVWMPYMDEADRDSAPESINHAVSLFRELGLPVMGVYHTSLERGPVEGSEEFEFIDGIAMEEADPRIVKNYPSAFTSTELEELLRVEGRNTLFLSGLSATGCVLATYFGAQERDFRVFMIEEALLSGNASYTDVIQDICRSVTLEELEEWLRDGAD